MASTEAVGEGVASERCVLPLAPYPRGKGEKLNSKSRLLEDQVVALANLKTKLGVVPPQHRAFCDDACLCRYLRARDWDVDKALKMLHHSLKWRDSYRPDQITPDMVEKEFESGKLYCHGRDKLGRPVMYQRPRLKNTETNPAQVQQVVYTLEREVAQMNLSEGVEQHVIIIDFKDYSLRNSPPMHVTKEVMNILLDQFPERLGNAFCIDAPWLFHTAFKIIKPFIPDATQRKIHFVGRQGTAGRNGKMDPVMAQYFDDDNLEEDYGGTLPSLYNHEKFWALELEHFAQQDKLKKEALAEHQ